MRILRWVFLGLYLLLILGFAVFVLGEAEPGMLIVPIVMIVAQGLLILGGGTINLCRPIRRRRLVIPIFAATCIMTLLVAGFFLAMMELLFGKSEPPWFGAAFFIITGLSWVGWGVLLFFHVREMPRYRAISRLTHIIFAGSLLELLGTVPAHLIVSRRPGCLVGMLTMLGIIAGCAVMLFSFGPMIVLLFLRPRYRREQLDTTHPICQACGYDLRASKDRCPECGLPFATTFAATRI